MTATAPFAAALVGATASGKSALALAVAREVNGDAGADGPVELVSVDSMALYRGMDIGTAKPSEAERRDVRIHLVDVLDPGEEASVALCTGLAHAVLEEIASRGKRALLVGGTGLHFRGVVGDLEIPPRFPEIAAALWREAEAPGGLERLVAELADADPLAASRIEPGNARRTVRALEVVRGTGRPFSSFGAGLRSYRPLGAPVVGLLPGGDAAGRAGPLGDDAIARRFHAMVAAGLLGEVRALAGRPGGISRTARQALGYRELLAVVEDGADLDEMVDLAIRRTRRFARRQLAWFRRDPRIVWMEADEARGVLVDAVTRAGADAPRGAGCT